MKYDNLRPGRSSDAGFLDDTESFLEIIEKDSETLLKEGITHEQIADVLETIVGKTRRTLELEYRAGLEEIWNRVDRGIQLDSVIPGLISTFFSYAGYQDCPLCEEEDDPFVKSDCDFTVTKGNESNFFSELHIHLIRKHHFFEGHTKYRLEPSKIIKMLNLRSGVSYKPIYNTEKVWQSYGGMSSSNFSVDKALKEMTQDKKVIYEKGQDADIPAAVAKRLENSLLVILPKNRGWTTYDGAILELDLDCSVYKLSEYRYVRL